MAREIKGKVISITEKYIYTEEIVNYERTGYQLVYIPGRSWCCTVFPSMEAAFEAAKDPSYRSTTGIIPQYVQAIDCSYIRVKHHRYKRV